MQNTYSSCFEMKPDLLWSFSSIMIQYKRICFFVKENRSYQHAFDKIKCENQYATGFALPFLFVVSLRIKSQCFLVQKLFLYCTDLIRNENPCSSIFISVVFIYNRVLKENFLSPVKYKVCLFWNKTWFVVFI